MARPKRKASTKRAPRRVAAAVRSPKRAARPRPPPAPISGSGGSGRRPLAIAGLGASAGGLAALDAFLSHLPVDTGVAYVVVTHQHPRHTSLLPELLAKQALVSVKVATHNARLEPNRVYVAPAGVMVGVEDGRLVLTRIEDGDPRLPIDYFFRSLAQSAHQSAIAIVLSGNGSDGTLGIGAVKAEHGMLMAQEPGSAQYVGMPNSAIATQLVDYVLPPEQMPARIVQYLAGRRVSPREPPEDEPTPDDALQRVLAILRMRSGNDFAAYKKSTIRRRLERRMAVHGLSDARDYARFLEQAPFEADALFREVLISVTSFFRDSGAFDALQEELTELIRAKPDDSVLRGWIAGCATGEEAYSLAIVVRELLTKLGKPLKVHLFATDLDPQAIDVARAGTYPEGISAHVTPERLKRFFTKEDSGYRINKDIREMLVFASQSVIKDPPFTRLDFVSCRNLLIYLEPELQRRVISLFGYALRTDGVLLLGTSEGVADFDDRFATIDKRWKLFKRREHLGTRPGRAEMPTLTPGGPLPVHHRVAPRTGVAIGPTAERMLLSCFTPPSAIVSERGEVVYVHGRTGPFLEPAQGEPSSNLFNMAREGLRLDLPSAIRRAAAKKTTVVRHGLQVKTNGGFSSVTLTVRPLSEPEVLRGTYLVSFEIEPSAPAAPEAKTVRGQPAQPKHVERLEQLEEELQHTKQNLQGMIEELETSNEELTSTNEELQSTNEELQSANEELETSREEMQSLNEELQTVNTELEERNRALSQANDDMQNLLNSTEVATVFLDDKLLIKRFTIQAKKVFSLIDSDVGRPISDLTANLRYTGLVEDAFEVLRTLVFREREIETNEGLWRLLRILPYRTHDNLIDGLVLTFVDIDRLKRAERSAQHAREYAEGIVEAVDRALLVLDDQLRVVSANRAFHALFRSMPKLEVGEQFHNAGGGRWDLPGFIDRLRGVVEDGKGFEGLRVRIAGAQQDEVLLSARRLQPSGSAPMVLITANIADSTEPAQT